MSGTDNKLLTDTAPASYSRRDFLKTSALGTVGAFLSMGAVPIPINNIEADPFEKFINPNEFPDLLQEGCNIFHDELKKLNNNLSRTGITISYDKDTPTIDIDPECSKAFENLQKCIDKDGNLTDPNAIDNAIKALNLNKKTENEEHRKDPSAFAYDLLGTGYFVYALTKLTALGIPEVNQELTNFITGKLEQDEFKHKLAPHFSRVDYGVSLSILYAAYESAKKHHDHERVHTIEHSIEETVVASLKVGIDIALSIVSADVLKPAVEKVFNVILENSKGNDLLKKVYTYGAIQAFATFGSALVSTNLGVSLVKDFIWEYAKIPEKGENGQDLYDMNLVYLLTAIVADLTGDVALFNGIIAAGDIAPREIALYNIGAYNLQVLSTNSAYARIANTLVGFPIAAFAVESLRKGGILVIKDRDGNKVAINNTEQSIEDSLEVLNNTVHGYNELNVNSDIVLDEVQLTTTKAGKLADSRLSFIKHSADVITDYITSAKDRVTSYPPIVQQELKELSKRFDTASTVNGIPLAQITQTVDMLKKGEIKLSELEQDLLNAIDKYQSEGFEAVTSKPHNTPEDTNEINIGLSLLRKKFPNNKVIYALSGLETFTHGIIGHRLLEHVLHPTLAEAMNVLPYQLLHGAFFSGVINKVIGNGERLLPIGKDANVFDIFSQNLGLHFPMLFLSGFADNGFAMSIILNNLIGNAINLIESGSPLDEVTDYLTIEIQKGYVAAQAGGMGSMIGCSAHFNNLLLEQIGILESAKIGIPVSAMFFIAMNIINSFAHKHGLLYNLDISQIPRLSEYVQLSNVTKANIKPSRREFLNLIMGRDEA